MIDTKAAAETMPSVSQCLRHARAWCQFDSKRDGYPEYQYFAAGDCLDAPQDIVAGSMRGYASGTAARQYPSESTSTRGA